MGAPRIQARQKIEQPRCHDIRACALCVLLPFNTAGQPVEVAKRCTIKRDEYHAVVADMGTCQKDQSIPCHPCTHIPLRIAMNIRDRDVGPTLSEDVGMPNCEHRRSRTTRA
jgi:hypothetical protein